MQSRLSMFNNRVNILCESYNIDKKILINILTNYVIEDDLKCFIDYDDLIHELNNTLK
jgi:hypothetical protein